MVALQTAAISTGLPFAVVMFFMCFAVVKGLVEHAREHGYD
jgi:choline-glycine betaine transporter